MNNEVSEKQKRLADYLGKDPSSISGRFEQAFKDQAKKEEERLQKLKSETGTSERRGSLKGKWDNVLVGTRKAELDKFENTKSQTKSQFQTTEGSGLVQKRIGQWEELIMQNAASAEHVNATVAAAALIISTKYLSRNRSNTMDVAPDAISTVPVGNMSSIIEATPIARQSMPTDVSSQYPGVELFVSGDTHLYDVKALTNSNYLQSFSKEYQNKPVVLPCGLYNSSEDCKGMIEKNPAIKYISNCTVDVVSLVMTGANGNSYICLTIICRSADTDSDPALNPGEYFTFGLRKVAIFDPTGAHLVLEKWRCVP